MLRGLFASLARSSQKIIRRTLDVKVRYFPITDRGDADKLIVERINFRFQLVSLFKRRVLQTRVQRP